MGFSPFFLVPFFPPERFILRTSQIIKLMVSWYPLFESGFEMNNCRPDLTSSLEWLHYLIGERKTLPKLTISDTGTQNRDAAEMNCR